MRKCYVILTDDHVIGTSCLVNCVFVDKQEAENYLAQQNKWFRDSTKLNRTPYYIEESQLSE